MRVKLRPPLERLRYVLTKLEEIEVKAGRFPLLHHEALEALDEVERERDEARAEVARLEGLILDWDDCWRLDPFQDPGAAARGDEGLMAEARRLGAQREQSKAHESDCPCVMCDPMQVRLNQQLRAQREEE